MILNHPSPLGPTKRHDRQFVGYWAATRSVGSEESLNPRDFVDVSWDKHERAQIVTLLNAGTPFAHWRGSSYCRFACGAQSMGSKCFTSDGTWVWPEGFAHYVEHHDVRPPQELVDHLLGLPADLVAELESRIPRIEAITAKWEPFVLGDGCPDKGTACVFNPDKYPRCTRGYVSGASCNWASDKAHAEYEAERQRHAAAIAPFCKHHWEPLG